MCGAAVVRPASGSACDTGGRYSGRRHGTQGRRGHQELAGIEAPREPGVGLGPTPAITVGSTAAHARPSVCHGFGEGDVVALSRLPSWFSDELPELALDQQGDNAGGGHAEEVDAELCR